MPPSPESGPHVLIDPGASGSLYFPHKNQVGTTLRVTDNAGAIVNTYRYDAWGQPFQATEGVGYQNRFNGKELDPDHLAYNSNNRRYHYPARGYASFIGRFLQSEPYGRIVFARTSPLTRRRLHSVLSSALFVFTDKPCTTRGCWRNMAD